MKTSTTTEPVWTATGFVAAVTALVTLLVAFGVDLTAEQSSAIVGLAAIIGTSVAAKWSRARVTPNLKVLERVEGDVVVAGPANERIENGLVIRDVDQTHGF